MLTRMHASMRALKGQEGAQESTQQALEDCHCFVLFVLHSRYFCQQFGVARWRKIAKALLQDTAHVALLNRFANADRADLEGLKQTFSILPIQCFR